MGAKRVVWHVGFGRVLSRRGPRSVEVRYEVPLSEEPPRMDYLILRKPPTPDVDDSALTLRKLWPLLPLVSVVEYKSPTRLYEPGDLDRLWGYTHLYYAYVRPRLARRADLCAVLAVHRRTPSLNDDAKEAGLAWEDLGEGYWRVTGGLFALYVVEIDVVAEAEGDDLLHSLGSGKLVTAEAKRFWTELVGSKEAGMSMQDMEGYEDLLQKLVEGMPPEKRLVGLDRDHQALALPVEILRALSEEYIRSLPPDVQEEIRRRLRRAGG
jgi:hypothetical protein